ncbi:MAG TPA: HepT-like ribonuclease domain-containing protein [Anaerolineae bacterium]
MVVKRQTIVERLKELGGFRNVLVHLYQEIDPRQVWDSYQKGLAVFPRFAQEVPAWLDTSNPLQT